MLNVFLPNTVSKAMINDFKKKNITLNTLDM